MAPVKGYEGIVRGDIVVLKERLELPEGTAVLVVPQLQLEDHWLTLPAAVQMFGISRARLDDWVRSGKVRVDADDPTLVNAGDVEDAAEQDDLFALTMHCAASEEE